MIRNPPMRSHPNSRATQSSIGSLLRDPEPVAPNQTPRTLASVTQGQSERPQSSHIRQYDGCSIHDSGGGGGVRTSRKSVKNESSSPMTEFKHVKGRATVEPNAKGCANPIIDPDSRSNGTQVKQFGRAFESNGNIITEPPSNDGFRAAKNISAAVQRDQKARKEHGDIITGANQSLAMGSGKRRCPMADTIANRNTQELLQ
uniref:Uncharacterized protein n=1 Tax=Hemiselmis andersenii TaxID=464988 RepID=A0A6T8H424_HEMAN